jgi:hypothetical protein
MRGTHQIAHQRGRRDYAALATCPPRKDTNLPVEDRNRTRNHVREQRAPGRTRKPDNVVLWCVPGQVVGAT